MAADAHDENRVELDLLLEEIYRRCHYDFRSYARSSLHRRIAQAQSSLGSSSVEHLRDYVIRDPKAFTELLRYLTIQVSDFFRDPGYHRILREEVMPHLATFPLPQNLGRRMWNRRRGLLDRHHSPGGGAARSVIDLRDGH